MADNDQLTLVDIKSTPPGIMKAMFKFCARELQNSSLSQTEIDECQRVADLIRCELGLFHGARPANHDYITIAIDAHIRDFQANAH